jgi:cobalt-zinc-cadmium efflux system membrane fusion protein
MNSFLKNPQMLTLSCVAALSLLFSCGKKDVPASTEKPSASAEENTTIVELTSDQYTMAGIELGKVETKNLSSVLKLNGMLATPPQNEVSVSPRIGGYIRSTPLLQGLRVRKGQALAVVEHQDVIALQQEFLEVRSRLEFAEAEFKRQEALQKENINAVKTFQQTATDYKSLKARLYALKQRLALIGINGNNLQESGITGTYTITSPIDGYVAEVNVTLGKFVSPNDVVCRIINNTHLHAELTVFERDVPKIREGQRVRFTLVNETEERTAKVFMIGREITKDRTLRVDAHLEKDDSRLVPNTALQALVELGEQPASAVADDALVSASGKDYIFIVVEDSSEKSQSKQAGTKDPVNNGAQKRFQMIEVKRGVSVGGWTEVSLPSSFDAARANVVVKGAYSLLSKMQGAE